MTDCFAVSCGVLQIPGEPIHLSDDDKIVLPHNVLKGLGSTVRIENILENEGANVGDLPLTETSRYRFRR